jgi:hypothetical protein
MRAGPLSSPRVIDLLNEFYVPVFAPWRRIGMLRLALIVTLLVWTAAATGQPVLQDVDSLEWMVADSSLIVSGTVIGEQINEEPEGYVWHTVAFRVDETLKGQHRPTLQFIVQTSTIDKEIGRWRDEHRRLLAFLDDSPRVVARWHSRKWARYPFAPRTGYLRGSFIELGRQDGPACYTLDLRALAGSEPILEATRHAIRGTASTARLCSHWFMVPGDSLKRLTVPVDSRLEAQARRWVGSADKDLRVLGASALVYFRSDENAELLKGLLNDASTWEHQLVSRGEKRRERVYEVRAEAWSVLDAWGYPASHPVTRIPLPDG